MPFRSYCGFSHIQLEKFFVERSGLEGGGWLADADAAGASGSSRAVLALALALAVEAAAVTVDVGVGFAASCAPHAASVASVTNKPTFERRARGRCNIPFAMA